MINHSRFRSMAVAIALAALGRASSATMAHDMSMPMQVGHVHLETSCSAAAAADIDEGVSFLYSFWYDAARRRFRKAEAEQPGCAMAWWGEAMSDWQQVERLPEGAQLEAGQVAVARAKAATIRTPREAAYIQAVAIIFDPKSRPEPATRVQAFADAMGVIPHAYPQDNQAAILHALPLLSDELPDDPNLARSREALAILNRILATEPDNPGVIHFIIHATDNPRMAALGLAAARRYATIAPASAHAQHMPGHIFARLGLWQEDIRSNLASKAAAEMPALLHTEAQNRLHAMEFLQYAYLQIGRADLANALVAEAAAIKPTEMSPGFEGYHDAMEAGFPTRQVLETQDWKAAERLEPSTNMDVRGQRAFYWAQAIGAGHLHDAAATEAAQERYLATYTRHELIERGCGVPGDEAGERGGEPCLRVDAVQLAGLDERGDDRPVVAALVGAGEQGVLAIEGEWTDRALDGVGVDLDPAVVKEPAEPVPAVQRVADRLGELALAAGAGEADLPGTGAGW